MKSDSIYIVKQTGRKRLYNIAQGKKPDALSASGRCCRIPEEKTSNTVPYILFQ